MKSFLVMFASACLVCGLAYVAVRKAGDRLSFRRVSPGDQSMEAWSERDKVKHPAEYIAHLRERIEKRRDELLRLLGRYEDRNRKYEFELGKMKEELARLESFFVEADKAYREGGSIVEVDGIAYSGVDFLRVSAEKDKRRKELVKVVEIYSSKLLQNCRVGKNLAEQALDKLQSEDRRLKVMMEELAVNERNDMVLALLKELDDVDSEVESLSIDKIRAEIRFGETEYERIVREGEAVFDAKVD